MDNKFHDYNETKQLIFDTAKNLFYEKGYYKTSIGNISESANVNRALISYYFQSKGNLALQIVNQFNITITGKITQKLYEKNEVVNPLVMFAAETRVFNSFRMLNKHYRQFMKEVSLENILTLGDNMIGKSLTGNSIYDYMEKTYDTKLSKVEKQIYQTSFSSIISGLIIIHSEGNIDCSHEYIAEKECEMYFKMLGLSKNEITYILRESKEVYDSIDIKMEENFTIK